METAGSQEPAISLNSWSSSGCATRA